MNAADDGGDISVLLVDDRPDNLLALEAILAPLGHRLVKVDSGEEALKRLLTEEFALILLDVMMPGMDGFETAARIKQREKTRDVPIIFLTALTDDVGNAMRGFSSGAVDFITKPFESWLLIAKVKVFIELYEKNRLLMHQRQRLARRLDERLIAEARQLRKIADAAIAINGARSLEEMQQLICEQARDLIGAHHAVMHTSMGEAPRTAVAQSIKYGWKPVAGSDLHLDRVLELVSAQGRPVRMTREDLNRHPARRAVDEADHPLSQGWLGVPLTGRLDRPVGVLQVADKVQGDFTDTDESILVQVAQMASVAVEKAELYHREHLIAETLQRSLLPAALADVAGLQLASRYHPGSSGSDVGGDWYDAVPLAEGRVALTIGDVVGRGVTAAAIMGQLRIAMRAYALQGLSPSEVFEALNRLVQDFDDDHFATAIYLTIDPASMELCMVNAGHPPPVLVRPDGSSELLEGGLGPPLNIADGEPVAADRITLEPGSTVFLYTDGLVEERGESLDMGLRRLQDVLEACTNGPEEMCDQALAKLDAPDKGDDVAVLAARIDGPAAEDVPAGG